MITQDFLEQKTDLNNTILIHIGCGDGGLYNHLLKKNYQELEYIGFDTNLKLIHKAKKRHFIVYSDIKRLNKLKLDKDKKIIVYAFNSLHKYNQEEQALIRHFAKLNADFVIIYDNYYDTLAFHKAFNNDINTLLGKTIKGSDKTKLSKYILRSNQNEIMTPKDIYRFFLDQNTFDVDPLGTKWALFDKAFKIVEKDFSKDIDLIQKLSKQFEMSLASLNTNLFAIYSTNKAEDKPEWRE